MSAPAAIALFPPQNEGMLEVYTGIIGWLVWSENPPANVWVGSTIVVASGLVISWRERVRARPS
jgi:drug/metabolite transporter (DMT)-like permease